MRWFLFLLFNCLVLLGACVKQPMLTQTVYISFPTDEHVRSEYAAAWYEALTISFAQQSMRLMSHTENAAYSLNTNIRSLVISNDLISESGIAYGATIEIVIDACLFNREGVSVWNTTLQQRKKMYKPDNPLVVDDFFSSTCSEIWYASALLLYERLALFLATQ